VSIQNQLAAPNSGALKAAIFAPNLLSTSLGRQARNSVRVNLGAMRTLVSAAKGLKPAKTPIWFMRQAGRYLPEYQKIRAENSFVEVCQSPELAAEVTLQPMRRFDLDAAILFADILLLPEVFGQQLSFSKGHGPILAPPVNALNFKSQMRDVDVKSHFGYLGQTLQRVKKELRPDQTLIGFSGAPFTVACYMTEGGSAKNFTAIKQWMLSSPDSFVEFIQAFAEKTLAYLQLQAEAGADTLMLFDSWGNHLSPRLYKQFVLPSLKWLIAEVQKTTGCPVHLYIGQDCSRWDCVEALSPDVLAVDWRADMGAAAKATNGQVCLQGNLDPALFTGDWQSRKDQIKAEIDHILTAGKEAKGHIFNVGHGFVPQTEIAAVDFVIQQVRKFDEREYG
jgi:uroporphyrinogen decarboxylase